MPYSDQDDFAEEFSKHFCPRDEQLSAITKLEGTSWYQGKGLVKDYIDQFQELIEVSEYSDAKTIVVKFRKGLNPSIQNRVALLSDLTPDFDDPKGWYRASRKVAQNKEANEAFLEASRGGCMPTCLLTPPVKPATTITRSILAPSSV